MNIFSKKEQIIIIILTIIIIILFASKVFKEPDIGLERERVSLDNDLENDTEYSDDQYEQWVEHQTKEQSPEDQLIKVYITGAVENPGVVELKLGDRIEDAVKKAGGLKESADRHYINLAKKVKDEDKIYVPEVGEYPKEEYFQENDENNTDSGININTADKGQLETLPGIGPVKAEAIIKYREENGPFKDIKEITNVTNIGERTFENIKDYICVD
ncbi:MAG: helix-hairpin-helix domain-containing protein [Clostridia bacterium]|nr:helix-hairpin-helix domain-containing protein [Clostridia bacterium]